MAGTDTRLLLLGAIALFEPVNAYQIRRELMSWDVQEWAHIQPGSIYSGLATLTKHGDVVRHDLQELDNRERAVAVYEITDSGRARMVELAHDAVVTPDPADQVALHIAVGLFPLLERGPVLEWLRIRAQRLEDLIRTSDQTLEVKGPDRPPEHAMRSLGLRRQLFTIEQSWLMSLISEVEAGGLWFAGEASAWYPSDDDPGWQMQVDRARYNRLLGRTPAVATGGAAE